MEFMDEMMRFMRESAYTCTEEWLGACIDWITDSYSRSQLSSAFMKKELYGQWLDANLMEMESKCLPPNLAGQRLVNLKGRFGLQVNSVQDIGESFYSQYTKLKKLENENTSVEATDSNQLSQTWQPKPRRCLYLSLTDGSQQIFGMEVLPIPALSLGVKPGSKVMLTGPLECRNGVVLLKPAQFNMLGGEVESLVAENTQENILARNLSADGNPSTPNSDQVATPGHSRSHETRTTFVPPARNNASLPTQPVSMDDFDEDDDIFLGIADADLG